MFKFITILSALFMLALPLSAIAQDRNISRELQALSAVNRINPIQNPKFSRAEDILDRRVVDRKKKVVGEVKDILIHQSGSIKNIIVDFNRLQLGSAVPLDLRQTTIEPLSDGYELSMDADELKDFYIQSLATIEPAAGEVTDSFSAHRMLGIDVRRKSGKKIAEIDDILFNSIGKRVNAIYIEMTSGTQRGEYLAIPIRSLTFKENLGRLYAEISDPLADAVFSMTDD